MWSPLPSFLRPVVVGLSIAPSLAIARSCSYLPRIPWFESITTHLIFYPGQPLERFPVTLCDIPGTCLLVKTRLHSCGVRAQEWNSGLQGGEACAPRADMRSAWASPHSDRKGGPPGRPCAFPSCLPYS